MKNLNVFLIVLIAGLILPMITSAQDSAKKELKLKTVKNENGNVVVVDTIINLSELTSDEDWEKVSNLLGSKDFKSLGIDLDNLEYLDNSYLFNSDSLDEGAWAVSKNVKVGEDGEKNVEVFISSDEDDGTHSYTVTTGGEGYAYFFSDEGDTTTIQNDGNKKIIVKSAGTKDGSQTITLSDEMVWTDTGSTQVDVETNDEGSVIKVTREDGTVQEYQVEEKGTYIIDEEGNIHKVEDDDDIQWNKGEDNLIWVTLNGDDDGHNVIVKRIDVGTSEINFDGKQKQYIIETEEDDDGNSQVFIKHFESKEGDKNIVIDRKVIVKSLNKADKEKLEKSGMKFDEKAKDLEIDNLSFSPNPTTGKFTLAFHTPGEGNTKVNIYDTNGREVYGETIKNFNGNYEKEIDISKENSGVYFLRITQGKKVSSRKIVLE